MQPEPTAGATGRLCVQAPLPACAVGERAWRRVLHRVGAWIGWTRPAPRAGDVTVQVADLDGHTVAQAVLGGHALGSRVDWPLPPGTYHVTVCAGSRRRCYTATLAPGATIHLHLPPWTRPDAPSAQTGPAAGAGTG